MFISKEKYLKRYNDGFTDGIRHAKYLTEQEKKQEEARIAFQAEELKYRWNLLIKEQNEFEDKKAKYVLDAIKELFGSGSSFNLPKFWDK